MSDEGLVKIHIDLPNHWAIGGESMWAKPLGNDLYRIENVPFYAYGLNYHDVVRAVSESDELIPEIMELAETSGHRTFRVFFDRHVERDQQEEILNSMNDLGISYERANPIYFALDLQPEGDHDTVFQHLEELEQKNLLAFETCEARIEGSFDGLPEKE